MEVHDLIIRVELALKVEANDFEEAAKKGWEVDKEEVWRI